MRFFEVVMSGAALVSAALAVEFNSWPNSVKAGQTVTLTYSPKDAATTIILRKGLSTDLKTLQTLTTTSTGGSFEWTVPASLENGADYAFEIKQGSEDNYSGQFGLSGGVASAVSSSAYSTKASSSAAPSSTAYSTEASTTIKTSVTSAASASASIVPSHGANSTISTGSPSATKSLSSGKPTGATPPVENTGAASSFGVNAAAVFGAMGALAYFA